MKKILFLGLVIGLVLSLTSPAHADNLLINSGFENWVNTPEILTVWWNMFNNSNVAGTKESSVIKSGSFSGKTAFAGTAAGAWGGWGQRIHFTAGDTLYANQPVNIPAALGGTNSLATLEIAFESAPDINIGLKVKTSRSTATSGWEALQYTAVAPPGTTSVRYVVLMETLGNGSGTAYFDDGYASNTPIPEPASMLLLGSGLVGMFVAARKKKQDKFQIK